MPRLFYQLLLVTITAFSAGALPAAAQDSDAQSLPNTRRYFLRNFLPIDYAGQNQMYDVVRDGRGVIYAGNNVTGVLEYDGIEWRTIALSNNNTAFSLAVGADDTVYVGGFGELGYLQVINGVSHYRSLLKHIPDGSREFGPAQVRCVSDGAYFNAGSAMYRWHDGAMTRIDHPDGRAFESIFSAGDRIYAADAEGSLFRITEAAPERIFEENPDVYGDYIFKNEYGLPAINLILPFDDDTILIGTYMRGLLTFDGTNLANFQTEADELLVGDMAHAATVLGNGEIAIGTVNNGVFVVDRDGRLKTWFSEFNGLVNNGIFSLLADTQNFLWVGTAYGFSQILYPSPFAIYDANSGLKGQVRCSVAAGKTLYVGTSHGVYRSAPASSALGLIFEPIKGIPPDETGTLKTFGDGVLAGSSLGLYYIENMQSALDDKQVRDSAEDSITQISDWGPDYRVSSFTSLSDQDCRFVETSRKYPGIVYTAAVFDGIHIFRHDGEKWSAAGFVDIKDPIFFGQEDDDGVLWVTSVNSGCYRIAFENGDFQSPVVENYYVDSGLPEGYYAISVVANDVYLYSDEGFYRFDRDSHHFEPDTTFFDDALYTGFVNEAPNGNVWITKGRPRRLSLAEHDADSDVYLQVKSPFQRFNQFQVRNFGYDRQGRTWFGADKSFLSYDPSVPFDHTIGFRTIFRKITVGDAVIFGKTASTETGAAATGLPQHFEYSDNSYRFDFAGLYPDIQFANTYQVRLDGLSDTWSEWSAATFKEYNNLEPGTYTFQVRAKNVYDTVSADADFRFVIFPPWWETWWFYCTEIGLLIVLLTTSVLMNRTGEASRFAKTVTLVTVVVIFESIMFFAEPVAESFGGGIPFIQLALNICLALALEPAQSLVETFLIGQRQRRKFRLNFGPDGTWNGGAHIIPTLADLSNLPAWIIAFRKEFADVGRKYGRYISNDWVLDDAEKNDLQVELEDLLGGLLLFRQRLTVDQPHHFSSAGTDPNKSYKVTLSEKHWKGDGRVKTAYRFDLAQFVDWYQDIFTDLNTLFNEHAAAMEDNVLSDDERTSLIGQIEAIFYNVIEIVRALKT